MALSLSNHFSFLLLLCMCMHDVYVWVCMPPCRCDSQNMELLFPPAFMWVPGIKLGLPDLHYCAASAFTYWDIMQANLFFNFLDSLSMSNMSTLYFDEIYPPFSSSMFPLIFHINMSSSQLHVLHAVHPYIF